MATEVVASYSQLRTYIWLSTAWPPRLTTDHQNHSHPKSTIPHFTKPTHIAMNLNKSKLQELCQSRGWALPQYSGTKQGPSHQPRFSASVLVHGFTFDTKTPHLSKKEAECFAAGLALDFFDQNPQPKRTKSLSFPFPAQPLASQPPPTPPSSAFFFLGFDSSDVWCFCALFLLLGVLKFWFLCTRDPDREAVSDVPGERD